MLRVVPVAGETCSPGDQEEDYSFLLNVIRISLAIGAVGGQLIGLAIPTCVAVGLSSIFGECVAHPCKTINRTCPIGPRASSAGKLSKPSL
jgi:hypothetical protein